MNKTKIQLLKVASEKQSELFLVKVRKYLATSWASD